MTLKLTCSPEMLGALTFGNSGPYFQNDYVQAYIVNFEAKHKFLLLGFRFIIILKYLLGIDLM